MDIMEIKKNLSVERVLLGKIFEYSQALEQVLDNATKQKETIDSMKSEIENLKQELKEIRDKEIMLNVEH